MRTWLVTVTLLFLLAQLYQWLRGFMLPLPAYVMAGAFLAIASNYEKGMASFFPTDSSNPDNDIIRQTASLVDEQEVLTDTIPTYPKEEN
ncbi:MAG: hypothetical protein AB4041_17630 [Microcystaceae cyanobacterium]